MRAALAAARLAGEQGEVPVGAVVVDAKGAVLATAANAPIERHDPTAHAEILALRAAGEKAENYRLPGATLYVTLEPCSHEGQTPPCADAIIKAGVARVVSAIEDPNPEVAGQGHARLREAGITVDVGICADEARRAHAGHIARITAGRPHVTLKLAVSADGKASAVVAVTEDLTDRFSAVELVRIASAALGGKGGGGRPDMAQAGGPDGSNAKEAVEAVAGALGA